MAEPHGPIQWTADLSDELQNAVDSFCIDEVRALGFSMVIADPAQPDCPLVACSAGFEKMTGYSVGEIVGRNCRFLQRGVPEELLDFEARRACRSFCEDIKQPTGDVLCVQTNARKTGELFRNLFKLKHVELDDSMYIVGLQAELQQDLNDDIEEKLQLAFDALENNMSIIEQVLAKEFWYTASMSRQS